MYVYCRLMTSLIFEVIDTIVFPVSDKLKKKLCICLEINVILENGDWYHAIVNCFNYVFLYEG